MRGSALLYGTFEPEAFGIDGDFYFDVVTNDVWHRVCGSWNLFLDSAKWETA